MVSMDNIDEAILVRDIIEYYNGYKDSAASAYELLRWIVTKNNIARPGGSWRPDKWRRLDIVLALKKDKPFLYVQLESIILELQNESK